MATMTLTSAPGFSLSLGPALVMPLTTVFTPPCYTYVRVADNIDECGPPEMLSVWGHRGYYSPGVCPEGYSIGCTRTAPATDEWHPFAVADDETAVSCVPRGFTCFTKTKTGDAFSVEEGHTTYAPAFEIRWKETDLFLLEAITNPPSTKTHASDAKATKGSHDGDGRDGDGGHDPAPGDRITAPASTETSDAGDAGPVTAPVPAPTDAAPDSPTPPSREGNHRFDALGGFSVWIIFAISFGGAVVAIILLWCFWLWFRPRAPRIPHAIVRNFKQMLDNIEYWYELRVESFQKFVGHHDSGQPPSYGPASVAEDHHIPQARYDVELPHWRNSVGQGTVGSVSSAGHRGMPRDAMSPQQMRPMTYEQRVINMRNERILRMQKQQQQQQKQQQQQQQTYMHSSRSEPRLLNEQHLQNDRYDQDGQYPQSWQYDQNGQFNQSTQYHQNEQGDRSMQDDIRMHHMQSMPHMQPVLPVQPAQHATSPVHMPTPRPTPMQVPVLAEMSAEPAPMPAEPSAPLPVELPAEVNQHERAYLPYRPTYGDGENSFAG